MYENIKSRIYSNYYTIHFIKINIMEIKVYSSFENSEYEKYSKHSKCLMNNAIWIKEWWAVFENVENNQIGRSKKLQIIVAEQDEEFIVLPLLLLTKTIKGIPLRLLEIVSQQWAGAEVEILYSSEKILKLLPEIMNFLRTNLKYDFCFFQYLSENTILKNEELLYVHGITPYVSIKDYVCFEDYKKAIYSKNLRQRLRSAANKAKKKNFKVETSVQEINEQVFEHIKRISRSKLNDNKHCIYDDDKKAEFYFNVFKKLKSNVVLVKINGIIVAYRVNIIWKDKKYVIDASYDREFRNLDLGAISVNYNISESFFNSIAMHSMGPGADSYKIRFCDRITPLYCYIGKGTSLKSLFIYPVFIFFIKKRDIKMKNEISVMSR